MSFPSAITSPRLTPIRKVMRWSSGFLALRSIDARCTSTAQRIDDAREFYEHAVAGGLVPGSKPGDPPVMLGDFRVDELATQRLEAFERAFLIRPHQPR